MFTGIVKGLGVVTRIEKRAGLHTLTIELPEGARGEIERGASISVDGVCLTVTDISGDSVSFDVMQQTLNVTTLGKLENGSAVNIERAARAHDEVGGHQLSGHIDCMGQIVRVDRLENNHVLTISVEECFRPYIFARGYIAINGASLTVASVDEKGDFAIWLIPETLRLTTFAQKNVADAVNIEIDRSTQVIVDTVRRFLKENIGLLKS